MWKHVILLKNKLFITNIMGEIATSDRQITLYYIAESSRAKQTLAFAKSEGLQMLEVDILKTPLTGTQIAELADRLGLEIKDLVNQEHPSYTVNILINCYCLLYEIICF